MAVLETIAAPDELVVLAPELDLSGANRLLRIAARAIRAYIWPLELPDPVPPPLEQLVLKLALRVGRATPNTSGAVVSESLGAYTYRLDRPLAMDAGLEIPDDLRKELAPWAPRGRQGVYDVDTSGSRTFPFAGLGIVGAGAFERDLDNDDPELAGGAVASS